MKSFRTPALLALVLLLTPCLFAADFGIRAGHYDDLDEDFVGAEFVIDLGILNVNPNIEYSLAEEVTQGSVNIDLVFELGQFARVTPFVGAGAGLSYLDNEVDNSTDLLGNLIGGISVDLHQVKPYAQLKYFRLLGNEDNREESDVAFTIGLRF